MTQTKDELIKARDWMLSAFSCEKNRPHDITTIIKALDAQIKACDVPKIEGLDYELKMVEKYKAEYDRLSKECEKTGAGFAIDSTYLDIPKAILEAARAYHKQMGGE
jgi:hypothetical protein